MAGYSGTPLPRKLGIGEHSRVRLLAAPEGFAQSIGVVPRARGQADVIVAFFTSRARLTKQFAGLRATLDPAGALWIACPRKLPASPPTLTRTSFARSALRSGSSTTRCARIDDVLVRPALRRSLEGSLIAQAGRR